MSLPDQRLERVRFKTLLPSGTGPTVIREMGSRMGISSTQQPVCDLRHLAFEAFSGEGRSAFLGMRGCGEIAGLESGEGEQGLKDGCHVAATIT